MNSQLYFVCQTRNTKQLEVSVFPIHDIISELNIPQTSLGHRLCQQANYALILLSIYQSTVVYSTHRMQFLSADYRPEVIDMGIGTVPPYMTSTLPGFGRRKVRPHGTRPRSDVSDDSYVEMDEWIEETKHKPRKQSKHRRPSASQAHRKQKERNPIKYPPKLPVPIPAAAVPYTVPMQKQQQHQIPSVTFETTSKEMSLGEFVCKHQQEFPVRVRVSRGFYGTTDRWSISEGELFNIHFVKYTKVVATSDGARHYNIPINSAAEFAYIYAPQQNIDAGLEGFTFPTVGDIVTLNTLPKLVRATCSSGKRNSPESSVAENELLIVKKVKKPVFGSRSLVCVNAISGQMKTLPSNCAGQFTTRPFKVCLFLPEVIEHITLPDKFQVFIHPDLSSDIPDDLFSAPVTLSHCSIETSLVATQLDANDQQSQSLVEIPIDLDIGVELVTSKTEDIQQLYKETRAIFRNFNASSIKKIPASAASGDSGVEEAVSAYRKGKENYGIQLQQPPRFANSLSAEQPFQQEEVSRLTRKKSDKGSRYSKFYKHPPPADSLQITSTMEEQIEGQCRNSILAVNVMCVCIALQQQVSTLTSEQQQLRQTVASLQSEVAELQLRGVGGDPPLKLPPKPMPKRPPPKTKEEEILRNKESVSLLTMPQVKPVVCAYYCI